MTWQLLGYAPDGVGEVTPGQDLATLLLDALAADPDAPTLAHGDVVVVTSKVVSKAEGRVVTGDRDQHLDAETTRVVARRGRTRIVRNRLGLTMAAAGIDDSNVAPGRSVLLPTDPDASARRLRAALLERTGRNLAVLITDTAGRAWREGQTDIAIGAAGLVALERYAGRTDGYGNRLAVTAPAVADELAGLAELVAGKLTARPFVLVRGRADLVLPGTDSGDGANELIRPEAGDLFGLGAREAVVAALRGEDPTAFGAPAPAADLIEALLGTGAAEGCAVDADGAVRCDRCRIATADAVAFAHGWRPVSSGSDTVAAREAAGAGVDADLDGPRAFLPTTP